MGKLSQKDQDRLHRIRSAVFQTHGIGHLSEFVQTRTFIRGKPFDFKGFEFQQAILDDPSLDAVVGKPRQVGMTELNVRLMLAFLATTPDAGGMLVMPHVHKALSLVKSRADPVIQGSPSLKELLVPGSDSSSFKAFGSSQLHVAGTYSGDVISTPIDLRVVDEADYCHLPTVATSDATMDNSRFFDPITGQRGIRRFFSTPITPKRGVHAAYQSSDKKQRLVHTACNHWFHPTYFNVVVDGWNDPIIELTPSDIDHLDQRGLLPTSRLLCPECRQVVPQSRLAPQYREWVAENPSNKVKSGWWVTPFDLPFDAFGRPKRTPEWLVRGRSPFGSNIAQFYNHRLGVAYADTTNSFLDTAIADNAVLAPLSPQAAALCNPRDLYGLVAGLDTGKPSYLTIARPLPNGGMDVLWFETIPVQGPNAEDLPTQVSEILKIYRIQQLVVDALPYSDSVCRLQSLHTDLFTQHDAEHPHPVLACSYSLKDTSLQSVQLKPNGIEVSAHRTRMLSKVASDINSGHYRFPRPDLCPLVGHDTTKPGTLRNHASNLTKIQGDMDEGDTAPESWEGSPDHWLHSVLYASIAASLVQDRFFTVGHVPLPTPRACTPGSTLVTALDARATRNLDAGRQGTVLVDSLGTDAAVQSLFSQF
jgi:hypothetical protein